MRKKDIHQYISQKFHRYTILDVSSKTRKNGRYFICKCECGNIKEVHQQKILSGRIKSCGCWKIEQAIKRGIPQALREAQQRNKLPPGESAFNWLFLDYQNNAKKRNHKFEIEKSKFRELVHGKCFYCNREPFNK